MRIHSSVNSVVVVAVVLPDQRKRKDSVVIEKEAKARRFIHSNERRGSRQKKGKLHVALEG